MSYKIESNVPLPNGTKIPTGSKKERVLTTLGQLKVGQSFLFDGTAKHLSTYTSLFHSKHPRKRMKVRTLDKSQARVWRIK